MKLIKTLLISTIFTISCTFISFAEMPNQTMVFGDKAYNLQYLTPNHKAEILKAFAEGGNIFYYKNDKGVWIDKDQNRFDESILPQMTYKDSSGNISIYKAQDGELITDDSFTIVDIK